MLELCKQVLNTGQLLNLELLNTGVTVVWYEITERSRLVISSEGNITEYWANLRKNYMRFESKKNTNNKIDIIVK